MKTVMERGDASLAAVASTAAAEYYGAKILEASIEDDPENYTRFFLLGQSGAAVPEGEGPTKTSLVFVTKNVAGALYNCMSAFALRSINMTKIESRPRRGVLSSTASTWTFWASLATRTSPLPYATWSR